MVKLFHDNRAIVQLLLPFIFLGYVFGNNFADYHGDTVLLRFGFWGSYAINPPFLFKSLSLVFVLLNGIIINTLFNRNEFFEKNSFLTVLLFVIFQSLFHSFYFADGLLLSQTFIILFLYQLFKLNQNEDGRKIVFNAAIFYGLACTFNPILLLGTPFIFWIVWIVRPFIFRESILMITGFVIPLLYSGIFDHFMGLKIGRDELSSSSSEFLKVDMLFLIGIAVLLSLVSSKFLVQKFQVSSIRLKKLFRILLLLTVLLSIVIFTDFLLFGNIQNLSFFFIPLVFILPYAFGEKKIRKISLVLFYILFIFSVSKFFIAFNDLGF